MRQALREYIDQKNKFAKIFNLKEISLPLSQEGVDGIARSLDVEMSPENLHCDGEISASQARARAREIRAIFSDLGDYARENGMALPHTYEL